MMSTTEACQSRWTASGAQHFLFRSYPSALGGAVQHARLGSSKQVLSAISSDTLQGPLSDVS